MDSIYEVPFEMNYSRYSKKGMCEYSWKLHKEALKILGGKCVTCGEDNILILQINHINGRKNEKEKSSYDIYIEVVYGTKAYERELDIRCANCNILYEYERGTRKDWRFP